METGADSIASNSPCVRLFLSVDLSGSTRLKNILNQQQLWARYRSALSVIDLLKKDDRFIGVDDDLRVAKAIQSLDVGIIDFDWSTVIETFYEDFDTELRSRVSDVIPEMQLPAHWAPPTVEPWKAVGDELIYVFDVKSRRQTHWLVIAFLAALRTIDKKMLPEDQGAQRHGLRLKGSAWVAGFPVRNRRVKLPSSKRVVDGSGDESAAYDYLGPEVDTGFRIGKCTRPGMLVVSVELAELLAEIPTQLRSMVGKIVGWEQLKGVWEERHYPVIWVDFPTGHLSTLPAEPFDDWELQESKYSQEWSSGPTPRPNLPDLLEHLEKIRSLLPASLGVINPYIITDCDIRDSIPDPHREIQQLLDLVTECQRAGARQDSDAAQATATELPNVATPDQIVDMAVMPVPEIGS